MPGLLDEKPLVDLNMMMVSPNENGNRRFSPNKTENEINKQHKTDLNIYYEYLNKKIG